MFDTRAADDGSATAGDDKTPTAVVYARYSTAMQSETSIDDQVASCRRRAAVLGYRVAAVYSDAAIGGAVNERAGLGDLLRTACLGGVDAVIAESLSRLSRDQADVAYLYKLLTFNDVAILTLAEGRVTVMHIGLKGTMNAMTLSDIALATKRAHVARVAAGRALCGPCYGYRVKAAADAKGRSARGLREIDADEAEIVRLIFEEYLAGRSPRDIAGLLNAYGVPGPRGRPWNRSTIGGNRKRGSGILNNELYVGRLIYNRQSYVKNPETGRRTPRLNPKEDWLTTAVPALRVVDQALWEAVRGKREAAAASGPARRCRHRKTRPLTGLVICGRCGGKAGVIAADRYGCVRARNLGACDNRRCMGARTLERTVLGLLAAYARDTRWIADAERRDRADAALRRRLKARLRDRNQARERLLTALEEGMSLKKVKGRIYRLDLEIELLEERLRDLPKPRTTKSEARFGRDLAAALDRLGRDIDCSPPPAKASETFRSLVEEVVISPDPAARTGCDIRMTPSLSGLLRLGMADNPARETGDAREGRGITHKG